jgi:hypothetical protein
MPQKTCSSKEKIKIQKIFFKKNPLPVLGKGVKLFYVKIN